MNFRILLAGALAVGLAAPAIAQNDSDTQPVNDSNNADTQPVNDSNNVPVYRVNVTEHTIQAIDYRHKGGKNHIEFAGTSLMPKATGNAEVDSKKTPLQIKAHFEDM